MEYAPVEQTVSAGPPSGSLSPSAPPDSKTRNSVLDLEHELRGILDALETAIEHGNAEVRILPKWGTAARSQRR